MLQNQPIPLKPGFKNLNFKVKKKKIILFYSCHISNKAAANPMWRVLSLGVTTTREARTLYSSWFLAPRYPRGLSYYSHPYIQSH